MIPDFFAVVAFSDDIAVLTTALAMIRGHMTDQHYQAADAALAERNRLETVKWEKAIREAKIEPQ
jgi:uncharacterized membrane protein YkvA (DUF1232 family)